MRQPGERVAPAEVEALQRESARILDRMQLQNRALAGRHGGLTGMTKFCEAADLWLSKLDEQVADGRRSPGTVETYRRQLKNHSLPAMGEVRLGEATTPLVDNVSGRSRRR